jgi:alkanesulfonate monooxygenase SsuD/methylene tetrahydromethanopterin reductase-like flavin-dependent oxidoreductase (luciferase family)
MFLGFLGGTLEHWTQYGGAYRLAWVNAGHRDEPAGIAVAVHEFVGEKDREAKARTSHTSAACLKSVHRIMFAVEDIDDVVARLRAHGSDSLASWCSTRTATGSVSLQPESQPPCQIAQLCLLGHRCSAE